MSLIEELKWRGLLHDIMPGTEELMEQERVKAYVGVAPTACGSTAVLLLLRFALSHRPPPRRAAARPRKKIRVEWWTSAPAAPGARRSACAWW